MQKWNSLTYLYHTALFYVEMVVIIFGRTERQRLSGNPWASFWDNCGQRMGKVKRGNCAIRAVPSLLFLCASLRFSSFYGMGE